MRGMRIRRERRGRRGYEFDAGELHAFFCLFLFERGVLFSASHRCNRMCNGRQVLK